MLEIDIAGGMEFGSAVGKGAEVVVKGEADLQDGGVFEEFDEARGEAHKVETEQEADAVAGNLEEGYLMLYAALE